MRYVYQPSFLESTRLLSRIRSAKLLKAIEKFQHAIENHQWPQGLGMTHLRNDYFEFRIDIQMRVIYRRAGDLVHYVLYGSHDQIRRFLKAL
ncbi:MAG: hypothetical protein HYT88_02055 [Candidatus Omnitrophica bacterium]|nr:hypothetical protein [Candidatus Omnitrophota bacterium]